MIIIGTILFSGGLGLYFIDSHYYVFIVSLISVGVGWNFVFISATAMLSTTYKENDKFKSQALNDMFIFGCSSIGVFVIGLVYDKLGIRPLKVFYFNYDRMVKNCDILFSINSIDDHFKFIVWNKKTNKVMFCCIVLFCNNKIFFLGIDIFFQYFYLKYVLGIKLPI